jgi:uncharacterized membrane protein YphA (DoxX/SURF4 family)
MQKISFHILRVGTAITFLWIGILIFQNPAAWGGYIEPWVIKLLPMSIKEVMLSTAVLDIVIGALLLFDFWVPWAAIVGAFHMLTVLTVSGINDATVRDIAILAGTLALFADSLSPAMKEKLMFWKKGT